MSWVLASAVRSGSNERKIVLALFEKHMAEYQANEPAAKKLISVGEREFENHTSPAKLAALTSIARVILNLHETISRP